MVALGGVALGVWSLMVVLGVMRGFQQELNKRWIGLNAHLTVTKLSLHGGDYEALVQELTSWPEISEANAVAESEIIIQVPGEEKTLSLAAKLKGVEKLTPSFLDQVQLYPQEFPENFLLVGHELAASLGAHPDFEENLKLVYPFGEIGPTGDFVPKQKELLLTNVFRTGLYEWDHLRIVAPLREAESLLGDQAETGLQIRLKNLSQLETVEKKLTQIVKSPAEVTSFAKQNSRLFAALKLERMAMTLLLILFGLIASFSITGLLLMFVDAKKRDLAILRALGVSIKGAKQIFFALGGTIGGVGALSGGVLGLVTCYLLKIFPIRLPASYYLDYLPVQFQPGLGIVIMMIGFLLAIFSSLYPVHVGAKMEPLASLREE